MSYGADAPDAWYELSESDRVRRAELTSDTCLITVGKLFSRCQRFFLRGQILLQVAELNEPFSWLVWVQIGERDFHRAQEVWFEETRESEPETDGSLASSLFPYPETVGLRVALKTRPVGERPQVMIREEAHPLAIEQRDGILVSRIQEFAETLMH